MLPEEGENFHSSRAGSPPPPPTKSKQGCISREEVRGKLAFAHSFNQYLLECVCSLDTVPDARAHSGQDNGDGDNEGEETQEKWQGGGGEHEGSKAIVFPHKFCRIIWPGPQGT